MKISCGVLVYRVFNNQLQVFLVHPGGPFFKKKDVGYWGISKGELIKGEENIDCAIREFKEETSVDLTSRKMELTELGSIIYKNGKHVYAWALQDSLNQIVDQNGFADLSNLSNKIEIKLGIKIFESPEIDKGQFFGLEEARIKINPSQWEFVERLLKSHLPIPL